MFSIDFDLTAMLTASCQLIWFIVDSYRFWLTRHLTQHLRSTIKAPFMQIVWKMFGIYEISMTFPLLILQRPHENCFRWSHFVASGNLSRSVTLQCLSLMKPTNWVFDVSIHRIKKRGGEKWWSAQPGFSETSLKKHGTAQTGRPEVLLQKSSCLLFVCHIA